MFEVLACVRDEHNLLLVGVALTIWLVGSGSLFFLLHRARESNPKRRKQWLFTAAITSGVAVWATHFIAMLAYEGSQSVTFDPLITALSVAVAVLFFLGSLLIFFSRLSIESAIGGGITLALGITAMHFIGMAAMIVQADIVYEWDVIITGIFVAAVFASGAFLAFLRLPSSWNIVSAALLSMVAVGAVHFTGMSATVLVPNPLLPHVQGIISREILIFTIVVAALFLIAVASGMSFVDRYMNDLQGLAEASTDGILILRHNRIIEANNRFLQLIDRARDEVVGLNYAEFLQLPLLADMSLAVEGHLVRSDQVLVPIEVVKNNVEYRGRECAVLSVRDLTSIKESQRRIAYLAQHDPLTGLPNRHYFSEALNTAIAEAEARGDSIALLALDLDRFKAVNDTFGHREGDKVLQEIATFLRNAVRSTDIIGRIGGDEFLLIQTKSKQPAGAAALAERIIAAVGQDRFEEKKLRTVGTSIGIAVYPDDAKDADSLRHAADLALYRAKEEGRGTVRFYDDEIDSHEAKLRSLEIDLATALKNDQFWLAYQPLVSAQTREIIGYETLLRWNHPDLGLISPEVFIPLAEESGLIVPLGQWVLNHACMEAAKWPQRYRIAVNVSAVQFFTPGFLQVVEGALSVSGLPADQLELEITETVVMRNHREVADLLYQLRRLGISIVMDDFGTGFSSLSNLQSLPFDKIKIDRSFIASMHEDPSARAIMRAIIGLGQSLDLPVVAEGVETEDQMVLVAQEGCTQVQGYLFGRPSAEPAHRVATQRHA